MSLLPIPEQLNVTDGNRSKNYDMFVQRWSNYIVAAGLDEKPEKQQLATLLTVIGSNALEVYNTFEWGSTEQKTTASVLSKFEKFCKPRKNITYERFLLMTRKQNITEKVDDYVKDLRILAESCEYGQLKESIIKDAFVLGVHNNKLKEHFLKEHDLTLEKALLIARASEKAREQVSIIDGSNDENVWKIDRQQRSRVENHKGLKTIKDCKYCGREHLMKKELCPAFNKKCDKCGLMNHFAGKCRTRNIQCIDNQPQYEDDDQIAEEFYIN